MAGMAKKSCGALSQFWCLQKYIYGYFLFLGKKLILKKILMAKLILIGKNSINNN